jgi:hypothetical protein
MYVIPWYPGVAERMAAVVPEARLVICVRDPIERAISHFLFRRAGGWDRRDLDTALASPAGLYVALGRYWSLLEPFLVHFPPERLLVVDQARLLRHRRETVRSVYRFAGVDDSFWSPKTDREVNRSGEMGARWRLMSRLRRARVMQPARRLPSEVKWAVERLTGAGSEAAPPPQLDPAVAAELSATLADDVARLRELTGQRFAGWSV